MGTHWVNRQRMREGFDLLEPDHLMFSPVNGKQQLVGVAYAFRDQPDVKMPEGFDGDLDRWHDHPFLAPRGETLHMLHVWFMDSPDGAFAGHNPFLPFWAAGLTPPDVALMRDSATASLVRGLAAALAVTVEPAQIDRLLSRFGASGAIAEARVHREAITALIPRLEKAQATGDMAEWRQLADSAAANWREIRRVYIDAAPPRARGLVGRLLDQLTGGDGAGH